MTDQELDSSYSAVCRALSDVGQDKAPLFLAMLCLSLISRSDNVGQVLGLVDQASARCQAPSSPSFAARHASAGRGAAFPAGRPS